MASSPTPFRFGSSILSNTLRVIHWNYSNSQIHLSRNKTQNELIQSHKHKYLVTIWATWFINFFSFHISQITQQFHYIFHNKNSATDGSSKNGVALITICDIKKLRKRICKIYCVHSVALLFFFSISMTKNRHPHQYLKKYIYLLRYF